jgi:hypothetical protein
MGNATLAYSSSTSTFLSAYMELLEHHLRSTLDLIATPLASTYIDSAEDGDAWTGADFTRLGDPEALSRFLAASDYCFGYFDSDEGGYDHSWECFNLKIEEVPSRDDAMARPEDRTPP